MTWQTTQALMYTLAAENARRPGLIRAPCLLFNPSTFPRGALDSTAAPVHNPFPFVHIPNPLGRDRIFVPVGWDSWKYHGGARRLGRESMGAGMGSVIHRPARSLGWSAAPTARVPVPRTGPGPQSTCLHFTSSVEHAADPTPTLQRHDAKQTFLEKNYDENTQRADHDQRDTFCTHTDVFSTPTAGLVGTLGTSSVSLPMVECTLAEMEGGLGRCSRRRTNVDLGSALSPT